ncbi:MAG: DUF1194 domain-containing protein [Proteobacteria bacterium]|nr:DUF1194 domain-containing protein [Pseudomonadota bacterium]
MIRFFVFIFSLAIIWQQPALAQMSPTARERAVDLELILMADGSGSVDDEEFILQRHGYAKALRDPGIIRAIKGGILGRIALSYVEWSGPDLKVPIVNWTVIRSSADLEAFAKILETHPRELYGGGTAVGDAIVHGAESILGNVYDGTRRVIDLSGDGPDRNGMAAVDGRDYAVAKRITVNGLPILAFEGDGLEAFYRDNVIGGPGAFYVAARGFKDFFSAVRRKLILEIAGRTPATINQTAKSLPQSRQSR